MDTSTIIKTVYQKAKTGHFAEVLQLIEDVDVKKETAINILICVSNACYSNKDSIVKDEICNLLNKIVYKIDALEECQLVPYLKSVFHIIKYMCEKEWIKDLIKMEFLIFPKFLSDGQLKTMEEGKRCYEAIIRTLCNIIYHLEKAKTTTHNNCLLWLMKIIFKAKGYVGGIKSAVSVGHTFLNALKNLEFQNNQLCEFYFILLDSLAKDFQNTENDTDGLQLLIHILSIIISDLIKAEEFQIADTFLDNVNTRIRLSFVQPEFVMSHLMFRAVSAIFPWNFDKMKENMLSCRGIIKELIEDLKTCHKHTLVNVIRFLEGPFCDLISYYKHSGCKIWYGFPSEIVSSILEFMKEDICSSLVTAPIKCSCGCSIDRNYCNALTIGGHVSSLLKCYINNNKSINKNICSEFKKWLIYFYELLKKVKGPNCNKWSHIYKELGTHTYNIGSALYSQENVAFVDIYQCFLKYSFEFEASSIELLDANLNVFMLNRICQHEHKNHNVEKCMALAALYCFLYPLKCNLMFYNWWIKLKARVKEDSSIQQQTLVSILEKHEVTVSEIANPREYLNTEKKIELLSYELLRYKKHWRSKESLMAAFLHLTKIAEVPKISQVIAEVFGDGEMQLHEEMPAIFSGIKNKIDKYLILNPPRHAKMALAVIYFYDYKYSLQKNVSKNVEDMEKTMQVLESARDKFEPIPKDPDDECDIVSAYSNLRLSNFIEILKPLNKSTDLLEYDTTQYYEPQIIKNISKILLNIGFEYRLHCFSIKSLQAFELSLKYAQVMEDNDAKLLAISFLIENADTKNNFVKELISQGDEAAKLLEKDNQDDNYSKTLAIYQISKVRAFLYEDADMSFQSWKIADVLVTANEAKDEFKFLRADLYMLYYKLTKSCSVLSGEHQRHPMTIKLHYAMDLAINLSNKSAACPYQLCLMCDILYELAKVYYLMRLPRDLRAYSKNVVLVTQKLNLPMRCVSFLILLAHSDLSTSKFDHCTVKLNGVNDIFCLSHSRPILLSKRSEVIESNIKQREVKMERGANEIQEMALDLPQHTRQYSPSSPTLVVESFQAPQFLTHEKNCICFMCLSFKYHQLLLQKYHLDALFNMYDKNEKMADEYLHGALMLYKTLKRNYDSYREKAKNLISESLIPNFDDSFREYYGNILYDYSFQLMRKSQKSEALKINTELVQLVQPKSLQYVYLYNDALLQRLSYVIPDPDPKGLSNQLKIETALKSLSLAPKDNIWIQNTPVSKKSTVTVTINDGCQYSPPKRRVKKKCALFTSPIDRGDGFKKSPTPALNRATQLNTVSQESETENYFAIPKIKNKKCVTSALGTPLLGDAHTPKIPIFTDYEVTGSVRKSRRQQPIIKSQVSLETVVAKECSKSTSSTKKSTRNVKKMLNSALVLDEDTNGSKENYNTDNFEKHLIVADAQTPKIPIFTDYEVTGSVRKSRRQQPIIKKQVSLETFEAKERSKSTSSTKKSTRNVRKTLNSALVLDENTKGSKEHYDTDNFKNIPIIAGHSKTPSQLLTQKIKASTSKGKTSSTVLSKNLVKELLSDKIAFPINTENGSSSSNISDTSSVISESPQHEFSAIKSKAVLEKVRLSAKRGNANTKRASRADPEVKKNLLKDFLDNEASSNNSTKHTGAIRKSTRNRVL